MTQSWLRHLNMRPDILFSNLISGHESRPTSLLIVAVQYLIDETHHNATALVQCRERNQCISTNPNPQLT